MNIKEFEHKYSKKGGMKELSSLRSSLTPQRKIARQFCVSEARVKQWMLEFFGEGYDARSDRKKNIIDGMLDFAKQNSLIDFRTAFKKSEYYQQAIELIHKKGIDKAKKPK